MIIGEVLPNTLTPSLSPLSLSVGLYVSIWFSQRCTTTDGTVICATEHKNTRELAAGGGSVVVIISAGKQHRPGRHRHPLIFPCPPTSTATQPSAMTDDTVSPQNTDIHGTLATPRGDVGGQIVSACSSHSSASQPARTLSEHARTSSTSFTFAGPSQQKILSVRTLVSDSGLCWSSHIRLVIHV